MESPMVQNLDNIKVSRFERLLSPQKIREELPLSDQGAKDIASHRDAIRACLRGEDPRLMVIIGPCSIHDTEAALEYAQRLKKLSEKVQDRFLIVMRVYFEKPRTTIGWKGLINDPDLDGTHKIPEGLKKAREFLIKVTESGLPAATEFLDPIVPQYISDLVSWAAIGARTTESQTHREMASGLSMPVGFKNATDGGLQVAVDAMISASNSHAFLGIDNEGQNCVVYTRGNPDGHLILRGGGGAPNYGPAGVADAKARLSSNAHTRAIMVDCSHGNSYKDHTRQPIVFENVIRQFVEGERSILGLMIESNLVEGNQALGQNMVRGQSITDACISWEQTEALLLSGAKILSEKT